jgi:hypothetical protein
MTHNELFYFARSHFNISYTSWVTKGCNCSHPFSQAVRLGLLQLGMEALYEMGTQLGLLSNALASRLGPLAAAEWQLPAHERVALHPRC